MKTGAKAALAAAGILVGGYVAVILWLRANENRLLFQPDVGLLAPAPAELGLQSRDVSFGGEDGVILFARIIPARAHVQARGWILYLHGASGNIGVAGYNEAWARFADSGLAVFAVDYRGYGQSSGTPSEAGMYADAEAAYWYLRHELSVPAREIFIYGYSLGSAVAVDLATKVEAAGLLVEGALLSVPERAAELYPYVPVRWLARNRFASVEKIARVPMPKLFLHARNDEAVPFTHGQRLYELALPPKRLHPVSGGHTTAYKVDPSFFDAVVEFVHRGTNAPQAAD